MNRAELVTAIAGKSGLQKKDAERATGAMFEVIEEALAQGDKIVISGFGSFEVRDRAARTGRNPQTGEEIQIAATKVPVFKPGKTLRAAVQD
ncbi:MAG: HU family DNA-binding protein [Bacillota bacterium]|nr:HU family DNA-binding protein [Bacillota bacterium]